jgi:peptide chain release factor 2
MTEWDDLEVMKTFTEEGEFSVEDLDLSYEALLAKIEDQELLSTLGAEEDRLGCILKINSGAGGTEACDWAEMLMRMYVMWAELKQHKIRKLDQVDGDVAGIKSVILEIDGEMAYGWLKMENGVHRLVRPSPYNAQGKRQTSFASVFVYPLVDDSIQIEVNPADLDWDVFRASGAGGQHVNRTESAVRLRHLPSGIVVACQEDRSQIKNREKAIQMLKSELYKMEIERRNAARALVEAGKQKIEWGSQIRSYVLDDRRIKDHRSGHTAFDIKRVLDGDIDDFLKATLMADSDALQEDFD